MCTLVFMHVCVCVCMCSCLYCLYACVCMRVRARARDGACMLDCVCVAPIVFAFVCSFLVLCEWQSDIWQCFEYIAGALI